MINPFNVYSLVAGTVTVVLLTWITIRQAAELKRPRDGFTWLRRVAFALPLVAGLLVVSRIPFYYTRIYTPATSSFASFVSVATSSALLIFTLLMVFMYTYKERK